MNYRPSDEELKRFEEFARGLPERAQMTARKLLGVGVVDTRNEAGRLMRYLDENGVLSSTSRNSGFTLGNLGALQYVRKGVSLIYPSNPDDPVIFIGKNIDGANLPKVVSLTLYESDIEIVPSGVAKTGGRKVVRATAEIRPPFLLTPRYERLVQAYTIKLGIPLGLMSIYTMRVGRSFELSASNAAEVASRPVTLLYYLHTHAGTFSELGDAVEVIMNYERRFLTKREAPYPRKSFDNIEKTFDHEILPFVNKQSPIIKQELQHMILDLWSPNIITEPEDTLTPVEATKVGKDRFLFRAFARFLRLISSD